MYLYLMRSPSMPFRTKIGITRHHPRLRASYIEDSLEEPIVVVFFIRLWLASFWEKTLHFVFAPLRAKVKKSSGYTEWFWCVRSVCLLLYPILWLLEWGTVVSIVVLTVMLIPK